MSSVYPMLGSKAQFVLIKSSSTIFIRSSTQKYINITKNANSMQTKTIGKEMQYILKINRYYFSCTEIINEIISCSYDICYTFAFVFHLGYEGCFLPVTGSTAI